MPAITVAENWHGYWHHHSHRHRGWASWPAFLHRTSETRLCPLGTWRQPLHDWVYLLVLPHLCSWNFSSRRSHSIEPVTQGILLYDWAILVTALFVKQPQALSRAATKPVSLLNADITKAMHFFEHQAQSVHTFWGHLKQLLNTFQWLKDPDYECASPAVFSIILGHSEF